MEPDRVSDWVCGWADTWWLFSTTVPAIRAPLRSQQEQPAQKIPLCSAKSSHFCPHKHQFGRRLFFLARGRRQWGGAVFNNWANEGFSPSIRQLPA